MLVATHLDRSLCQHGYRATGLDLHYLASPLVEPTANGYRQAVCPEALFYLCYKALYLFLCCASYYTTTNQYLYYYL